MYALAMMKHAWAACYMAFLLNLDEDNWPGLFLKKTPDLITDGCDPSCSCWELNSEHLEQPAVLLAAEIFLDFELFFLTVHGL